MPSGSVPSTPQPFALAGGKELIFTLTTGRSGTELLSRALALFPGVTSRHEPKPTFSSAFRAVMAQPKVAREFWLQHKLPKIAREPGTVYCETSHLCSLGFLESLVELGGKPTLIVLRRQPRAVARSLCSQGDIPGRTLKGLKYYLAPQDRGRTFLEIEPAAAPDLHDYQLCYWYALELDLRAKAYQRAFAPLGLAFVALDFGALCTSAGVLALAQQLRLPQLSLARRGLLARRLAQPVNARPDRKRPFALTDLELDQLEAELRSLARPTALGENLGPGPATSVSE